MKDFDAGRRMPGFDDESAEHLETSLKNFEADMNAIEGFGFDNMYIVRFEEIPVVQFVYTTNERYADRFLTGSLANVPTNEK